MSKYIKLNDADMFECTQWYTMDPTAYWAILKTDDVRVCG